ncbi:NACHT, LRR and PYD domains-containing protein 3-like isoform X3 [Rana temporaria]|uniref:NACHT, LRR and PYD domains-containing protein 3-like isoform X3 n=1 Tax=Rana temporaria TaxID=8407 RepID=UPI001AAD8CE6|nr:NACHT, LRR and PYD domains-containing protein 3-like isoform X3 [Rana temporaria]
MAERLRKTFQGLSVRRTIRPEDIGSFPRQLSAYDDPSLRIIYEHYRDDLISILENLNPHTVLVELTSRNVLNTEEYLSMEKDPSSFSHTLLQDIQDRGREAVIGLWECLCALQKDHHHPNLLAVLDEITQTGEGLPDQILLDELGHSLTPELREIQEKHKQHLMEKTETLEEHRPPGTTLEPQTFPFNERYVNLIVVSTDQFRERPQNELIQTGVKHEECLKETQTGLEHISPNKLFRWNPQSHCVPRAVMVSGVPGIGKTTLMQKFVYDWVTGKHYQRFAFLFFFRFRDLNRLGEVSLEEMILHQYPHLGSQIGDILQDPERLLFIFDGLDESIHQMDFRSSKLSNPKQRSHFGKIVVSLVRQSLLKGCSVLITSRPTRLASVDTGVFQRIAEIMGFLHEDRRIFFNNFFGNEELSGKAFHYVQENDTLYTFCYIPSYCWIICTVLSMCFRAQPITDQLMTSLPKTVTQLFVTFVSNILANHSQNKDGGPTDRELLTSIGWMAEHGVMNHMIVFDKRDLESFNVRNDNHLFSSFMMESGQPPDVDYTFLHLTLQEFFAALVHFINYNADRLQKTLGDAESYEDGRVEIFLRFLCGLSDTSTRSLLKSHGGELSTQAARHVITWIQKKIPKQTPHKSIRGRRELLNVFYYLYESRNKALVSQCIGSNNVDFSEVPLSPLDCSVLSFILQSCRDTEEVNLSSCKIQSEGLRKLIPALHKIKSLGLYDNHLTDSSCPHLASVIRNNQTLRTLDLTENNLEGPDFRDLMEALTTSRIEELQLKDNHLTDSSCPHLASGIRNNQTLRTLDLTVNNLEGPHFRDLMEALTTSRIEELRLSSNNLTDRSCPHLTSGIRNNQTLRTLDLSDNNLEGPHFRDLMEALTTSRIEELQLYDNHLTDRSCPHLASGIRNNQTLRTLDLSGNNLEGPHFRDLMEALTTSRIEELQLYDNHLTDSSCPHLASGIRNNQTLRTLGLSENNLEGPDFRDLMEALTTSRIEELQLDNNHLTDSSCPHLASGIRNNQTLRTLDLSDNNLEGPHFRDLMEALTTSQIEELRLSSNHLTESSCPHLASGIRNNQTLRTLDLSNNNLEGPDFRDLMEALTTSRIEKLQLYDNHLTDSSCPHLASGIRNNQTLRTLDLSDNNLEGPHFRDLMEALTTSRIEELRLYDNHLTDSSCPHLTSGIRNNQTLRTLDLTDNNLGGPHFRDLMEALTTSRIEELRLYDNHLTDSSFPHLASGIRNNQTLRTLDLSMNNLGGPHFRDLMEALTTSRIEELQIRDNNLSEETRRELRNLEKIRPEMKIY